MESEPSVLRSVHTESFAAALAQLGVSVAVSTYQAGFVVLFRHDAGKVNTHFRACQRPMGLAASAGRLAVGEAREVVQYWNMADVAGRLPGSRGHDACYLPRKVHVTGDIDIHEMAYGVRHPEGTRECGVRKEERQEPLGGSPQSAIRIPHSAFETLWFVNTRFSCLCTLDDEHSFVPKWRPSFVSGLSPQDRCHLNGLAMIDGRPKYVTALGRTDAPQGWRESKARGGLLIDVESGETIVEGLSMPHSPRWHDGRLWMLESGDGSIGTVDLATGKYEAIARLDGFTRGLDFLGPYALIGISQVRESAIFSGIPITERLDKRICGVSLVDLRAGREVGFVRFEEAVQEIFAVQALPHAFPELVERTDDLLGNTYALPQQALGDVEWLRESAAAEDV